MPIYRFQAAVWHDSLDSRDACVINPVINATAGPADTAQLAQDLIDGIQSSFSQCVNTRIRVKVYDVQQSKPNYPLAIVEEKPLIVAAANACRELAIVLSFYSHQNVKRKRGRLFIPLHWMQTSSVSTPARPTSGAWDQIVTFVGVLKDLGGLAEDWSVYSEVDDTARAVTDWWIDNEWDVQRSRGLKANSRVTGTTTEDTLMTVPLAPPPPTAD